MRNVQISTGLALVWPEIVAETSATEANDNVVWPFLEEAFRLCEGGPMKAKELAVQVHRFLNTPVAANEFVTSSLKDIGKFIDGFILNQAGTRTVLTSFVHDHELSRAKIILNGAVADEIHRVVQTLDRVAKKNIHS